MKAFTLSAVAPGDIEGEGVGDRLTFGDAIVGRACGFLSSLEQAVSARANPSATVNRTRAADSGMVRRIRPGGYLSQA